MEKLLNTVTRSWLLVNKMDRAPVAFEKGNLTRHPMPYRRSCATVVIGQAISIATPDQQGCLMLHL